MSFSAIFRFVAERVRRIFLAKEIKELKKAEAAARKKTTIAVVLCVVIAAIAGVITVGIYLYFKNEQFNAKVNEIIAKIKSKIPFFKKSEEEMIIEEIVEGDVVVEEIEAE